MNTTSPQLPNKVFYAFFWILLICLSPVEISAQNGFWQPSNDNLANRQGPTNYEADLPAPEVGAVANLNLDLFRSYVGSAADESTPDLQGNHLISLPLPDGTYAQFAVVKSSLLPAGLAARYQEIGNYSLQGVDDPTATGRMTVSPYGLRAYVASSSSNQDFFVRTLFEDNTETHLSYWGHDSPELLEDYTCGWEGSAELEEVHDDHQHRPASPYDRGDQLRVFRMAITVPGDLAEQQNWTTKAEALAAISGFLSEINVIYERDVAVRFTLIENNDDVIYLDSTTDPFIANGGGSLTDEHELNLESVIGFDNYDIAMVFVTQGCCAAGLPSVCTDRKAQNFSRYNNLRITCHEIGHQFRARHTWSMCNTTIGEYGTAEYGSGISIMSYIGICGVENMPNPGITTFFTTVSAHQIADYIASISCGTDLNTGNTVPEVVSTVPTSGSIHIPRETPYVLTANATDVDGDALTYSWEQADRRSIDYATNAILSINAVPVLADGNIPIQRNYNPVSSPSRTIPALPDLLANTNSNELLPTYDRTIKYRVYVRDNSTGGGGTTQAEISIDVDATTGPFLVTAPNTCVSWMAGSSQTVTWDVAGTDGGDVNVSQVNILLSTDGGYTYPYTLATATANDGTESISIPGSICSNRARIKVEAVGNIFFDVSNEDFNIEDGSTPVVLAQSLSLDGVDDQVNVNATVGDFGQNDFTVETWVKTTTTSAHIIGKREGCTANNFWNIRTASDGRTNIEVYHPGVATLGFSGTSTITDGQWHHIGLVRSGGFIILYVDGVLEFSTAFSTQADLNNTADLTIGKTDCGSYLQGEIDEVKIWSVAQDASYFMNSRSCPPSGLASVLLYYTMDEAACGSCANSELIVDASNNTNNGTGVNGATKIPSDLDLSACATCANGNITVTTQPSNISGDDGDPFTLTYVASGTNIAFQWYEAAGPTAPFVLIAGATSNSYSFTASQDQNTHRFYCLASNGCDVESSTEVTLSLTCPTLSAGTIIGPAAICTGEEYTYSVPANTSVTNWVWTVPADWSVTNFDNLILVTAGEDDGNVSLTVTDECGTMASSSPLAVVANVIEINLQPQPQTANEGSTATFSVGVTAGGGTTTYQWEESLDGGETFSELDGETSGSLNLSATLVLDDRIYRCVVQNDCILATSTAASLTVNCTTSVPGQASEILGASIICASGTYTYSVAEIPGATSYSWTLPNGWTGSSITNSIVATSNNIGGTIQVAGVNACGTGVNKDQIVLMKVDCERAVHFDGNDDFLSIAHNSTHLDDDLTISFWLRPDRLTGLQQIISNGYEFRVYTNGNSIRYEHSIVGGGYDNNVSLNFTNAELMLGEWQHLAISRDVSTREVQLYLNGSLIETLTWDVAAPSQPDDNLEDFVIGAGHNGLSLHFRGSVDEVRVWTAIRSNTEIVDEIECNLPVSPANLAAYYDLNEGTAYGDNSGLGTFPNAGSAYLAATHNNFSLNGTTSNVVDRTGRVLYRDSDMDGFGDPNMVSNDLCATNSGYVSNNLDCDDTNPNISPLAFEVCGNSIDENCDGQTDYATNRGLQLGNGVEVFSIPVTHTATHTVEAWFKIPDDNVDRTLFRWSGTNTAELYIRANGAGYSIRKNGGGWNFGGTSIVDDQWHHVAMVHDGYGSDNVKIYVDGALIYDQQLDAVLTTDAFSVGSIENGNDGITGFIDDVRYWDVALTPQQIQDRKDLPLQGNEANLIRYYRLDQGFPGMDNSGLTQAADASSSGQNATLQDFNLTGATSNWVSVRTYPTLYPDADMDGFAISSGALAGYCFEGSYSSTLGDCNDTNPAINPLAVEVCGNNIDENCDGETDYTTNRGLQLGNGSEVFNIPVAHSATHTVEAWFKVPDDNVARTLFRWSGTNSAELYIRSNGDGYAIRKNGGGWNFGGTSIVDDQWHHVAWVHNGYGSNNVRIYVDGNQIYSQTLDAVLTTDAFSVGSIANGNDGISGFIDDVRYWDVALTTEQIQARKDLPLQGTESNLIRYYRLDQGLAGMDNAGLNQAVDVSGSGQNASLSNFTLNGATSNWVSVRAYPTQYPDADMDGFATSNGALAGYCFEGSYSTTTGDCDDTEMAINPYAVEVCGNNIDDDCDGDTDFVTNKGLHFDNSSGNYIDVPGITTDATFTVETWVKLPTASGSRNLFRWEGSGSSATAQIYDNGGTPTLSYNVNGGPINNTSIVDDQWHHLALVVDGYGTDNTKWYVDGLLFATRTEPDVPNTDKLYIGSDNNGNNSINGTMDDIRIWDDVRTAEEIAANYNRRLDGDEAGLIRYYPLDTGNPGNDNSGINLAKDRSSSGQDATLENFLLTGTTSNWVASHVYPARYLDSDLDGFGDPAMAYVCGTMDGYVINNLDCNDALASISPTAIEVCGNGIDENCDGETDFTTNRGLAIPASGAVMNVPGVAFSETFTVEAWFQVPAERSYRHRIFEWAGDDYAYLAIHTDGLLIFESTGNGNWRAGPAVDDGAWHHLAFVHSGYGSGEKRAYLDGQLVATYNVGSNITAPDFYVGGRPSGSDALQGNIDEVRYWDAALTAEQIQERMNLPLVGNEANLVRYYRLDQGNPGMDNSGLDIAGDASTNGVNANLIGFALNGTTSNWVATQAYPTQYADGDNDDFGVLANPLAGYCFQDGYVLAAGDCNDTDPLINPTAADICGNGIDENCNGFNDDNTLALDMDGSNDQVDFGTVLGNFGTGDFSIEVRVKTTAVDQYILSKRDVCNVGDFWNLEIGDTGIPGIEVFENGVTSGSMNATNAINDGNWHSVVITRTGNLFRIYVDGVLEGNMNRTIDLTNNATLSIGGNACNAFRSRLNGQIDELRIWNKALDATTINAQLNASLPMTLPGLIANYNFNNPTALGEADNTTPAQNMLEDLTGTYPGTLIGFALNGTTSNWVHNPEVSMVWYADVDEDGYGDAASSAISCFQPMGFVSNDDDCVDSNPMISPVAPEIVGNNIDDNCNGATDEVSSVRWVLIDENETNGSCGTSTTDCCTNTYCYGLEFTPANTGTLVNYTTGFLTNCIGGNSPLISNTTCILDDNSTIIPDCGGTGQVFFNSSGNNGSTAVTVGTPIIIHQICLTIPAGQSIPITEEVVTDITVSIDLPIGTTVTENPDYTAQTFNGNQAPVVTAGSIDACYTTEALAEAAAIAATTATDDCADAPTLTASTTGSCSAVITVTATDACGLMTSVTYNTSIDGTDPTVTAGTINSCYETVALAEAAAIAATTASDNCPGTVALTASTSGDCTATITVTGTDACGRTASVTYNTSIDATDPTVTAGTINSCYETVALAEAAAIAATTASDNCPGTVALTASTSGDCTATITVTGSDACGRTASVTYNTSIDATDPTVTAGTINSCYETEALAEAAAIAATTASDNCPGTVALTASTSGDCTATITVTGTDACGRTASVTYNTSIDATDPTVTAGTINSCYETVALAEAAAIAATTASDNCPGTVALTASTSGDCTATITVTGTDACGRTASVTYNTSIDATDPTVTAGTINSCYETVALAEAAAIAATTASDNCPGTVALTASTSGDCTATITVTGTDACGRTASVTYNTSIDATDPTVTAGTINSCYETEALAEAAAIAATTASDNCPGTVALTASTTGDCAAVITVTGTDACGRTASVTYNTSIDATDPTVTAGTINSCYETEALAEAAAIAATTASDNCPGTVTLTASTTGDCAAVITVTGTDACGRTASVTYNTSIDATDPTVTAGTINSCYETVALAEAAAIAATTASDNCPGTVALTASTSGDCTATITVTGTDACGRTASVTYNTSIDAQAPLITGSLTMQSIDGCSSGDVPTAVTTITALENLLGNLEVSDNCTSDNELVVSSNDATSGSCPIVLTRTYTISDNCSRSSTVDQVFEIFDNTAPSFTAPASLTVFLDASCGLDVSTTVTGNATGIADNCSTGLSATFVDVPMLTGCDGTGTINRVWSLVDDCGNSAADQIQVITVEDNTAPTFTAPGPITISLDANCNYNADPSVTGDVTNEADNCGSSPRPSRSLGFPISSQQANISAFEFHAEEHAHDPNTGACITDAIYEMIFRQADENVSALKANGNWPYTNQASRMIQLFDWPLRQAAGWNYNNYYVITNYVDQDPSSPGILDYNGGQRTYDGHNGIDISTFPFGKNMQNRGQVEVISAAPGVIVDKNDGEPDDNCSFGSFTANYVIIEHADGSRSWYYHMKTGTVTLKPIGATVATGELLGIVASSGVSTGPHLHFEVRDLNNNVIEPFAGPSNNQVNGTTSWWNNQQDYRVPTVNYLSTNAEFPIVNNCPAPATLDEKTVFHPGEDVRFYVAYRDLLTTTPAVLKIYQPDGNLWNQNVFNATQDYSAANTSWSYNMPNITGEWQVDMELGTNAVISKTFFVVPATLDATYTDVLDLSGCGGSGTITRTWSLSDCSGNTTTHQQIITVVDDTPPTATAPADITGISCIADVPAPDISEVINPNDNCLAPTVTHLSDVNNGGSGCTSDPYIVTRTYQITDACSNSITVSHTITVIDNEGPVITGSITASTIEGCSAANAPAAQTDIAGLTSLMGDLAIADGCTSGANLTVTHQDVENGSCPIVITRTYTITDACMNSSTAVHTINIDDSTAPAVTGSLTSVNEEGCDIGDAPTAASNITALLALAGDLNVTDACTPQASLTVTHADMADGNTCPLTITRTYTITDACMNASTVTQSIVIDDSTAPAISGSLTAAAIEGCDASNAPAAVTSVTELEALTGDLAITDNCTDNASLVVTFADVPDGNTCPLTITRTYTITDACMNASTAVQSIVIDDSTAPAISGSLNSAPIAGCDASDAPTAVTTVAALEALDGNLAISDNCTDDANLVVTSADVPDGNTCPLTITRTYTITDACMNASTVMQSIVIDDDTDPVLTVGTIDACYATLAAAQAAAETATSGSDNCNNAVSISSTAAGTCPTVITVTGTDPCGNSASVTYNVNINDSNGPVEVGGPVATVATVQIGLDAVAPTTLPVFQDQCGTILTPSAPVITNNYIDTECRGTISYTYTYTDCSGQTTDWTFTYTIDCGKLNIRVLMEGPYTSPAMMTTTLGFHHLLPGQDKMLSSSFAIRLGADYTPFGQPYNLNPWDHNATSGAIYGDASAPAAPPGVTPYPEHVTDWVLVSIRENSRAPGSEIFACAGWLHENGEVSFPEDCATPLTLNVGSDYYIVIEHRNHLTVLNTAVNANDGALYLDANFTTGDSYVPIFFRVGQREIEPGVWAMFSSNPEQNNSRRTINSTDRTVWRLLQNYLGYQLGDHNLDGSVNSLDESTWKNNQNKSTGVSFE